MHSGKLRRVRKALGLEDQAGNFTGALIVCHD